MTYNPMDTVDVHARSGEIGGGGVDFAWDQPGSTNVTSSGGVTIDHTQDGARVNLNSPTSGDNGIVEVPKLVAENGLVVERWVVATVQGNDATFDSKLRIGASDGTDSGAYLDVQNEQFNIGGNTQSTTVNLSTDRFILHIKNDQQEGTTTIETFGSISDSYTVNTNTPLQSEALYYEFVSDTSEIAWLTQVSQRYTGWE